MSVAAETERQPSSPLQTVVGRFYQVPCVRLRVASVYREGDVLPVIGPEHDDAEIIGVRRRHWHFDWRFMPERIFVADVGKALTRITPEADFVGMRRRKCLRSMPAFPLSYTTAYGEVRHSPFSAKLEDAYENVTLPPGCRTCPHRGVPLVRRADKHGNTICPGHGLMWNIRSGKLVRRTARTAQADGR